MADINELRASMRSANVYGKGQYFEPGRYLLEVDRGFYQRTMIDGTAKESVIFEFRVLESTNPDIEVGSTRSSVFSAANQGWLSRLKSLQLALHGGEVMTKDLEEEIADHYVALREPSYREQMKLPDNFYRGFRVNAEAMAGKSRSGVSVTNMKWSPAESEG